MNIFKIFTKFHGPSKIALRQFHEYFIHICKMIDQFKEIHDEINFAKIKQKTNTIFTIYNNQT